ncbi:MAG: Hsp20/alpha crystallin family protein [Parvibaculum sp.]|uniref:Hsp20/alpha crystallin family protein n=1 Tax=Parvibaculum sp. TaxID=2024848 RepID=UPI002716D107|nr:Hsp20/alpha crystallin family protein [Parvibaculum sp.]MDO8840495.1 Hsp20/alpha crystallin family protein [Parvibaculum sp.]
MTPQRFMRERETGNGEMDIFRRLRGDVERLFDDFSRGFGWHPDPSIFGTLSPHLDVTESDDGVTMTAELPGMDEKDVEVTLTGDLLSIKGEKKEEHEEKKKDYHLKERSWGSFERTVRMPFRADSDAIKASFSKGVLKVEVPKPADVKKACKKIEVKSA